ncbi:hypothetical protein Hdeb2414_s1008g00972381 [Helianthus debilis subsp. tardiflorus]
MNNSFPYVKNFKQKKTLFLDFYIFLKASKYKSNKHSIFVRIIGKKIISAQSNYFTQLDNSLCNVLVKNSSRRLPVCLST